MRPLLLRQECPICGSWATFYLDTYDRESDTCSMKSMEHGHTVPDQRISSAFRALGLLPADTAKSRQSERFSTEAVRPTVLDARIRRLVVRLCT